MVASATRPVRDMDPHVIWLAGELDLAAISDLTRVLDEAVEIEQPTVVLVDMSQVTFIDCTGLHPLLEARERLHGRFRLCNPSPPVLRLLGLLDLWSLTT